jgi:hypothetical protein
MGRRCREALFSDNLCPVPLALLDYCHLSPFRNPVYVGRVAHKGHIYQYSAPRLNLRPPQVRPDDDVHRLLRTPRR